MARPGDRRPLITAHAISVLAAGGARALTHQAVDRSAGLPAGSTSYYFRSRRELIAAAIEGIRARSNAAFTQASLPATITPQDAADFMEGQLLSLAGRRRDDALAVFALLPEVQGDWELRAHLSSSLFSRELATDLIDALGGGNAHDASLDLIDFLTGLLFGLLFGQRRESGDAPSIANTLCRFLMSTTDMPSRSS
ncbi:TetR family transcriptional regulator [Microbacterium sp. zg-YB36]|uniref:TetR/AcrR family transcriptional regulator n=1 Tax=Microbacterium sp. zg-YB36 TaxID=2969407 RepID=UPI00214B4754|nr:TetR family transcriptional regulator [Microbacterium sp. zg-YB36]MDL5350898.1 TetR family transcriptional regulator [Microbacterium sp. zg-YB36]